MAKRMHVAYQGWRSVQSRWKSHGSLHSLHRHMLVRVKRNRHNELSWLEVYGSGTFT